MHSPRGSVDEYIIRYYDVTKEADEMEREAERNGQAGMHMNVES
jgi:hypothetical protein